ncbi:hypothetical protein [Geobacillus stearothermophilus]|uniref:hypothetical protein n=1 Tax=Geobacillus stearothermophilus TaxID=1422 RepID=UPI002E1B4916|nr:hypothetical protein [Geobacillus stearothermophilus]
MDVINAILAHADKLTGNETKLLLALYAKQSQTPTFNGFFTAGTSELVRLAGMTMPTMLKARQGLQEKGLITFIKTVKGTEYRINIDEGKEILPCKETLHYKESLPKTNNPYEIELIPLKIEI